MRKPVLSHTSSKGAYQPAHPHNLISVFLFVAKIVSYKTSSFHIRYLQITLLFACTWLETLKTDFLVTVLKIGMLSVV